ncbi:hypothetical protein C809_04724 [Lachnospiraceae bacterium MD335]|nr:hypothetical protein C809_04724 [Lachnospiraceae bacterium MD335]
MAIQYTAIDFLTKLSQSNYTYTNAYRKKVHESNKDVEALQVDVAGLKKTVKDLGKSSKGLTLNSGLENLKIYYKKTAVESKGEASKTRFGKQLQTLVKTFNSLNKNAEKVPDKELEKQLEKLENLFDKNEKDLKKIGLKKKDGKYVFDSEVFEEADNKVINRLMEGKDSFIKQTEKIMRKIETRLEDLQYNIVDRNMMRTTKYDNDEITLASSFALAKETTNILGLCGSLMEEGALPEEFKEEVTEDLGLFITAYNNADKYESEDFNTLKTLCEEKETELAKVGISFVEDAEGKKTMQYDAKDFDDPDFQNAYVNLFGKDSDFVKNIADCCNKGFNNTLTPEKVGVSIVDVYV